MIKQYTSSLLLAFTAMSMVTVSAQSGTTFPAIRDKAAQAAVAHRVAPQGQHRSDPIWSDDFSDSTHWVIGTLNGTTDNWVVGTTPPSGDYAIDTILSTTAANGFALFDSDLMCNTDNGYIATAAPIDLSGVPHVQIRFEQFYRRFGGQTFVDVSADGNTWSSIEVNAQLTIGAATANPTFTSVDISAVAGSQPTVWFRFRYVGNCDYAWMVDDVALVEQPAHELSLISASTTSWNANTATTYDSVYYSVFPVAEIRPLAVNMVLFNAGYEPATNVVAHITTSDGYDQSSNLGTMAPGDTLTWFAPQWTPTATGGDHTVEFSAQAESADADTTDNAAAMTIEISNDFIMARDNGARQGSVGDGADPYKVGNWFHLRHNAQSPGILVAFSSTSEVGVEVNGQVMDQDMNVIAETGYHALMANDLSGIGEGNFILLPFSPILLLDGDRDYFVAAQHFGGVNVQVGASGLSEDQSSMLYRSSNNTWYSISPTPMVRLVTDHDGGIDGNYAVEQNLIDVWPNPADGDTRIQFQLERFMRVDVELQDLNGRPVRTLVSGALAVGTHKLDVDTRGLASGVYSIALRTAAGTAVRRLVVMH